MHADLAPILGALLLAVALGATSLTLLTRRDLAPAAGLRSGAGRWALAGVLGVGMVATVVKLTALTLLATYPERTIAPLLTARPASIASIAAATPTTASGLGGGEAASPSDRAPLWRPLPDHAPSPWPPAQEAALAALGAQLFQDRRLSADGTVACGTCHDVIKGAGAEARATSSGVGGRQGWRNAPSVYNAGFQAWFFWDGRARSLEAQALGPLLNPDEMAMPSAAAVAATVAADPAYRSSFAQIFAQSPDAADLVTPERVAAALAAYQRGLISADAPYDRFVRGDDTALTPRQQRGMWLFDQLGCVHCHAGPNFSGASLIGPRRPLAGLLAERSEAALARGLAEDKGRAPATARVGVWRIPSLRNVALTAPYFHNGSVWDLTEAVRIMATAQLNAVVAPRGDDPDAHYDWSTQGRSLTRLGRRAVSDQDIGDLAAFLRALSGDALAQRVAAQAVGVGAERGGEDGPR